MSSTFAETLALFEVERVKINKRQAKICWDMHELGLATSKIIAHSRELIRQADALLSRNSFRYDAPDKR